MIDLPCRLFFNGCVAVTRRCVVLTIVDTDHANCFYCDRFTFVSPQAVVALHRSIDYLVQLMKISVVYLNCPIGC